MKKFLLGLLILISCVFVCNKPLQHTKASSVSTNNIYTLYPNNTFYYQDLDGLKYLSVNEDYIAYTLDNNINVLNLKTKHKTVYSSFTNIYDIELTPYNQLIIVTYNNSENTGEFNIINLNNSSTTNIETISLDNLVVADTYVNDEKIYFGIIRTNSVFDLYEINLDLGVLGEINRTEREVANENFVDSKLMTITDTKQIVIFDKNSNSRAYIRDFYTDVFTIETTLDNIQLIDYFSDDTNEYLVAFTLENLSLLSLDNLVEPIHYLTNLSLSDIATFDNAIFINNTSNNSINKYIINNDDSITINKESTLICSNSNELGRFNSVSDIYIQGDKLFISDTNNNRIQIIDKDLQTTEISDLAIDTNPHSVLLDNDQNIYFIKSTSTSTSSIVKYSQENNISLIKDYSTINSSNLGSLSDMAISSNNEIFAIDYINNKLAVLSNDTQFQYKLTFNFTTNSNTKIEYLKALDKFIILNENVLYLLDPAKLIEETNPIISSLPVDSSKDITCDTNSILLLENNKVSVINIKDNTIQTTDKSFNNTNFSDFSTISYDIKNRTLYAFNNQTQAINYLNLELNGSEFNFEDITHSQLLHKDNKPIAISIKNNALIYDLPYHIGNSYKDVTKCIGISSYNNYYRVIFEYDNNMQIGFIESKNCEITDHNTNNKIKVLATNIQVPVYKYPTLLKYNNQAIINTYIPINTYIYITEDCFPISIDTKHFYMYEIGDTIGYIFNADVVLDDDKNIIVLQQDNATISAVGLSSISVYNAEKDTIITSLSPGDRIYVENYDKDAEYTLISFKTENLEIITGYVRTEYIEMDTLEDNKIILICIIIFSIILLISILISYLVIKKKKSII